MLEKRSKIAEDSRIHMFERTLKQSVLTLNAMFPVVMVTGPRQMGKSTLLAACAQDQPQVRGYVTLEDFNARDLAVNDPALFLQQWPAPVIIDEIQYAPGLVSAIKVEVDRRKQPGMYWLTVICLVDAPLKLSDSVTAVSALSL